MIDERLAFEAMLQFVEAHWERTGRPDAVGALLGDINTRGIWADGTPGDPGTWEDWLEAIEAARRASS
jgi:hypothetical protein